MLAFKDEENGRLHRGQGIFQHIRELRRPPGEHGKNCEGHETLRRLARQQDKMGCSALAHLRNGTAGADELKRL